MHDGDEKKTANIPLSTNSIIQKQQSIIKDGTKDDDDSWKDWIPPDRPLAGDQGQSQLYSLPAHQTSEGEEEEDVDTSDNVNDDDNDDDDDEKELLLIEQEMQRLEATEKHQHQQKRDNKTIDNEDDLVGVDWLKTRRQTLSSSYSSSSTMVPADQGKAHRDKLVDIEVKLHTLLTKDEIATVLSSTGGKDITIVLDNPADRKMGGMNGMIVCTGMNPSQLRVMGDAIVRQLRLRQLQQFNVVGAQLGVEGADNDSWLAVDCRNYVVHMQDEATREMVDLVGLWSSNLKGQGVPDHFDDDAVDDYVAKNPVPEGYGQSNWSHPTWMQLEKNRWTAPHRPVIPIRMKAKRIGKKKKMRRR